MDAVAQVPVQLRPHVRRHLRRYYAGLVAYSLAAGTALWVLVGVTAMSALLGGLVGSALVERWRWWRRREHYLAAIEVRAALRTGTHPRPELRQAVQREAGQVLRDTPVAVGLVCLVCGGLALACAVVAAIRDDARVVLPAALCLAFAAWSLRLLRTGRARAQRWLAAPPPPRPEDLP